MSRMPALGPRGEGWVALQVVLMVLLVFAGGLGPGVPLADPALAAAVRDAGWLVIAAAGLLLASGMALLSNARAFTAVPRPMAGGRLVESGPYALIRHPIYASLVLAGVGLLLVRQSWFTLALTVALFLILDLKRRREEAWLAERYEAYAAYRARTKALIPFLY